MTGLIYKLLDGISRAYNRFLLAPSLKRSLASCGENVVLGRRFEVAGAQNISMGHDVYLGPGAMLLTTRAKIIIGDWVMAGPNIMIVTGDHRTDILDRPMMTLADGEKLPENDQDVIIGSDVWLGGGVIILKGVHIADHCVIAAGSVVTKSVQPPYSIWGGVPARFLGSRLRQDDGKDE